MSFDPSILPHFVAEMVDNSTPKYVTYCCTNIVGYDFTKPDNYIGTTQKLNCNGIDADVKLTQYFSNYHEADAEVNRLLSQMMSSVSGNCNCHTKIRELETEIKKLKEEILSMDDFIKRSLKDMDARIATMRKATPNDVELFIERADVTLSRSLFERALNAESPIDGAETVLMDAGLWPVPAHLGWKQLNPEHTRKMNEIFNYFTLKLLEKKGVFVTQGAKEFKELNTLIRTSFQNRTRYKKNYLTRKVKRNQEMENKSTGLLPVPYSPHVRNNNHINNNDSQ